MNKSFITYQKKINNKNSIQFRLTKQGPTRALYHPKHTRLKFEHYKAGSRLELVSLTSSKSSKGVNSYIPYNLSKKKKLHSLSSLRPECRTEALMGSYTTFDVGFSGIKR